MSNSFNVMAENPNIPSGSNGCLCDPMGGQDTKGPFIAFIGTETDNPLAPYPVLCAGCLCEANELIRSLATPVSAPPASPKARRPTHAKRSVDDGDGPSI